MSIPTPPATVTVAGGNLYALAARHLGSATLWDRIAALNGLTDPWLLGVVTLRLPRLAPLPGNGGILGAP